ncbi:type II toxin-antitoxin system RelE/ParE family toxin [Candidatus Kaiserbacteria bacterium]|nr:MAG: type II toxin-antitoxin system RelE/ParE family toxin [Candidatus Kaiserbacteria bacterium]
MQINLLNSVELFIESLYAEEITKVMKVIDLLEEFENNLGMPHSKYLENGLLELRIRGKREIRILYCFHKNSAFLLHAFIKKTQKTPEKELTAARVIMDNLH